MKKTATNNNLQSSSIDRELLVSAYNKALLYATRKLSRFEASGLLSKITPEDVANEAVAKTLSGQRPWNKEKCPDLFVHLAGVIHSMISNIYHSSDFVRIERGMVSNDIIDSAVSNNFSSEESLELESKVNFVIDYLVETKEGLKQVAEIMLRKGVSEPKDISEALGISVAEVNTKKLALKRLMNNTGFLLHYITQNRPELRGIARAMYKEKLSGVEELSERLDKPPDQVRLLKRDLDNVVGEIYKGNF